MNSDEDPLRRAERDSSSGAPRWVKVTALIGLVVVALFVILLLSGRGGEHGPGRHGSAPEGAPATQTHRTGPSAHADP